MKCQVCGAESGKYPFCKTCNAKREAGQIKKCPKCGRWHCTDAECPSAASFGDGFLYQAKNRFVTNSESKYFDGIKSVIPDGYSVYPQINLASFITRTDNPKYQNELFRNVDFLITDNTYKPLIVIEINDPTHLSPERKKRDAKVSNICEESGIPLIKLWTDYGANTEYIKKRITETRAGLPAERVHHFSNGEKGAEQTGNNPQPAFGGGKKGCYIATCVYGSYDCPQVRTFRRFRDDFLAGKRLGRLFIRSYYAIAPR